MILRVLQVGSGVHGTSISGQDNRDEMDGRRRLQRPANHRTRVSPP